MINIEKIYLLQDDVLTFLGGIQDFPFIFSGSTLLARAYLQHRNSYNLDFFAKEEGFNTEEIKEIIDTMSDFFDIQDLPSKDFSFPKKIENKVIQVNRKKEEDTKIQIIFWENLFVGKFETVPIEFGVRIEDMSGVYNRKINDIFNESLNTEHFMDLYALDEEIPLEMVYEKEFIPLVREFNVSLTKDDLKEKLQNYLNFVENDKIKVDKELKFYGVTYNPNTLEKWLKEKIQILEK